MKDNSDTFKLCCRTECATPQQPATTEFFRPDKKSKDGLTAACRDCLNSNDRKRHAAVGRKTPPKNDPEYRRAYYEANRDKELAKRRVYVASNVEQEREYQRRYREGHREEAREYARRYRAAKNSE